MDKYHLHEKLASYCMLTMTRSVCCVSLFLKYKTDIIEASNSTSRHLDELLNNDIPYFEQMVGQIYPTELQ